MDREKTDRTQVLSAVHPLRMDPEAEIQTVILKIRLSDDFFRDLDEITVSTDFHIDISPGVLPEDYFIAHDILRSVVDLFRRRKSQFDRLLHACCQEELFQCILAVSMSLQSLIDRADLQVLKERRFRKIPVLHKSQRQIHISFCQLHKVFHRLQG